MKQSQNPHVSQKTCETWGTRASGTRLGAPFLARLLREKWGFRVAPSKHETKSKSPRLAKTCETWGTRARALVWVLHFSRAFCARSGGFGWLRANMKQSQNPHVSQKPARHGAPAQGHSSGCSISRASLCEKWGFR